MAIKKRPKISPGYEQAAHSVATAGIFRHRFKVVFFMAHGSEDSFICNISPISGIVKIFYIE
jgi:hypothetical protein